MSFLITFIAMWAFGYSVNNLTLMALTLAIGFLVDDAIVFLENVVRRAEAGESIYRATLNSAGEISFTILSMTLSLAAVFIPLAFMPGLLGRIFREFAITIIVAILASGLVSLTLTPLMCSRMLVERGPGHRKTWMERFVSRFFEPIRDFYGRSLDWFLDRGWLALPDRARLRGRRLVFLCAPSFHSSADRRQRRDSRLLHRAGRRLARAAARAPGQARSRPAGEPGGRQIFHRRGPLRARRGRLHRALFEGRERAGQHREVAAELRKACSGIPGRFSDPQSAAGAADQYRRDRQFVRPLQLCPERHQSGRGLCRGRQAGGEAARLRRLRQPAALRSFSQHAQSRHRHRSRPRRPLRRLHHQAPEPAPRGLLAELRLPDQAGRRPIPGHPGSGRRGADRPGRFPPDLRQAGQRRQTHPDPRR